jgi:hypothetical protein
MLTLWFVCPAPAVIDISEEPHVAMEKSYSARIKVLI